MKSPEGSRKGRWLWWLWIAFAVAYEAFALTTNRVTTLTGEMRRTLLKYSGGSALLGGFIAWLGYHWTIDSWGLSTTDLWFLGIGAVGLGIIGHRHRTRRE